METQLALALNGVHRTEICEAIAQDSGHAGQKTKIRIRLFYVI